MGSVSVFEQQSRNLRSDCNEHKHGSYWANSGHGTPKVQYVISSKRICLTSSQCDCQKHEIGVIIYSDISQSERCTWSLPSTDMNSPARRNPSVAAAHRRFTSYWSDKEPLSVEQSD